MRGVIKLRIVVGVVLLLAAATWFSFGCGGGSSAAPSGGGDAPVAVEIPNLDVGGLDTIILQ